MFGQVSLGFESKIAELKDSLKEEGEFMVPTLKMEEAQEMDVPEEEESVVDS